MRRSLGVPAVMLIFLEAVLAQGPGVSGQGGMGGSATVPSSSAMSVQAMSFGSTQSPLLGGVPQGKPEGILQLSLSEALKRGLNYNLGALLSRQSVQAARGARLMALSQLLPQISAGIADAQQQTNLAAFGFSGFPGMKTVVGPYNLFDARATVSQSVLDFSARREYRASVENVKAAEFSDQNTRDLVVFVCANLYLQALASSSRIEATRAQVNTAQALYNLAVDQKAAGVSPGIEVLRAQVELQAQQQRLIVAEDQFAKDKLALARAIGLPLGQEINLTDGLSFVPVATMSLDESVQSAYKKRADYQSAQARVRAAELERKAALAKRLPAVDFNADYGDIGQRPWESHGTFTVKTSVRIPIFLGGSVQARVMEADSALSQREAELEDLKGRIYYDIRNAFLDLKAAADRVQVAQSASKLADEQVAQSQDRFRAGVTNNVEVVQAQEALATASENHISSLQAHGAAKLALAKAIGLSDTEFETFLRGRQ
jgi:outer membrane protein TolC